MSTGSTGSAFPICEIGPDGTLVMTKAPGTGGCVSEQTVKEQLLYEIHDPRAYLTPDVVLDLGEVEVRQVGPDRVAVTGARGKAASRDVEGDGLLRRRLHRRGRDLLCRAERARPGEGRHAGGEARLDPRSGGPRRSDRLDEPVRRRRRHLCLESATLPDCRDVRLRIAVAAKDRRSVEAAVYEVGALYTCGPAGGAGVRNKRPLAGFNGIGARPARRGPAVPRILSRAPDGPRFSRAPHRRPACARPWPGGRQGRSAERLRHRLSAGILSVADRTGHGRQGPAALRRTEIPAP